MTLLKSSLSITRYQLIGGPAKLKLNDLNECISGRSAKNLRISGVYKDLNYGWVRPVELCDEPVPESRNWDMSDCRISDGYLLRLRIEKRQVPTTLMQLLLRERIMAKEGKREKPLSRVEKKELRENLKRELIEGVLPSLSYIDAYWNESKSTIQLFSTSKRHQDIFEEIFRDSFLQPLKISMVRVLPPILGLADEQQRNQTPQVDKVVAATPSMMV